jgi:hypothetical protein
METQVRLGKESEDKVSKDKKKDIRHKYGEYNNVLLSDPDFEKLKSEFPYDYEERIERLSEYMASTGKPYKNHLATIRNWAKKDKQNTAQNKQNIQKSDYDRFVSDLKDMYFESEG